MARGLQPCEKGACFFGGGLGFDETGSEQEGVLVVDARPASAEVFLDGRPLGTAGDLIARALPLAAGEHVVAIVAPAYRPWIAWVTADPPYSTRLRVSLVPR